MEVSINMLNSLPSRLTVRVASSAKGTNKTCVRVAYSGEHHHQARKSRPCTVCCNLSSVALKPYA
eukprot:6212620-Pleurochrysis_carterae.AAC.1